MILGDCPYEGCDHFAMRALPDTRLPAWSREACEGCHQIVWVKYTRVDPIVYTEADFNAEFVIDEEKREIVPRSPPVGNIVGKPPSH